MVGKRVQFDNETWAAIEALSRDNDKSFQELTDEAFADLLKKHKRPVGLKAALEESVEAPARRRASTEMWCTRQGSNLQPPDSKSGALSICATGAWASGRSDRD